MIDDRDGYTPTPVVSHAILSYTSVKPRGWPTASSSHRRTIRRRMVGSSTTAHCRPADASITGWIQDKANEFLMDGLKGIDRIPFANAKSAATTHRHNYMDAYMVISRRSSTSMRSAAPASNSASIHSGEPASATGR